MNFQTLGNNIEGAFDIKNLKDQDIKDKLMLPGINEHRKSTTVRIKDLESLNRKSPQKVNKKNTKSNVTTDREGRIKGENQFGTIDDANYSS